MKLNYGLLCMALLFAAFVPMQAAAQNPGHAGMNHSNQTHGELVSGVNVTDRAAFRIILQTFAPSNGVQEAVLKQFLFRAQLSEDGLADVVQAFSVWRTAYDGLFKKFQDAANADENPDVAEFRRQRNLLVTETIQRLNNELSTTDKKNLFQLVQWEKAGMTIDLTEEGQ